MEDSQERECHSSLDIMFAGVFPREFHPNRPTFGTVEGDLPEWSPVRIGMDGMDEVTPN